MKNLLHKNFNVLNYKHLLKYYSKSAKFYFQRFYINILFYKGETNETNRLQYMQKHLQ